jgi:hypothetical protein
MGRVSRHIFTIYGGAHKSMKTWHKMYVNDVSHTIAALNTLEVAIARPTIFCVLSGPFTPQQKAKALRIVAIHSRSTIIHGFTFTPHTRRKPTIATLSLLNDVLCYS